MSKQEPDLIAAVQTVLEQFAQTKVPGKALELKGPVKEGTCYRWRIMSTRHKQVTFVVDTAKALFKGTSIRSIVVYGTQQDSPIAPDIESLKAFLDAAELIPN
jgi:hypothetical protein